MDFPSLVKNNKNVEIRERGHDIGAHKPSSSSLNATIIDS